MSQPIYITEQRRAGQLKYEAIASGRGRYAANYRKYCECRDRGMNVRFVMLSGGRKIRFFESGLA